MEQSEIKTSKQIDQAVLAATSVDDIRHTMHEAAIQQGLVTRTTEGHTVSPVARDSQGRFTSQSIEQQEQQDRTFSKTEIIADRMMTFSAPSAEELDRMIADAHTIAEALQDESTQQVETRRHVDSAADVARKTELELRFKRGEISPADYLEQSGAVAEYLENQGVPIDVLRTEIQEKQSKAFEQSWEEATQTFLNSPEGADWAGGQKNLEIIGTKIHAMGLVDAEDKVAALKQAWQSMKQSGTVFAYEPPASKIAERAAAENTSPAELLEHWKQETAARGLDPNASFVETHRKGRLNYT